MGQRRNRRRCRRRSDVHTRPQSTRSKPYENFDSPFAFNRWNRNNTSTALSTDRNTIEPTLNWQNSYEARQLRTLVHPQYQYQHQQIHNQQPLQQLHDSHEHLRHLRDQQQQQRPNDVVSRYIANQQLERARMSAVEAQRIHFFGGEIGDEVSLCAPMLQVVLDLWGGVDYLDP